MSGCMTAFIPTPHKPHLALHGSVAVNDRKAFAFGHGGHQHITTQKASVIREFFFARVAAPSQLVGHRRLSFRVQQGQDAMEQGRGLRLPKSLQGWVQNKTMPIFEGCGILPRHPSIQEA